MEAIGNVQKATLMASNVIMEKWKCTTCMLMYLKEREETRNLFGMAALFE